MTDRADRRRTKGRYADPLNAAKKSTRSLEGQHGQVVAPDQQAIRDAIEAGKCPWCGRGPYALLAGHTSKRHGIDRYELRDLAGLTYNTSICDPGLSEKQSQLAKRRKAGGAILSGKPRRPARISDAARQAMRERAQRWTFEERSAAGKVGGPIGGAIRGAQVRKERPPCAICGGPIPFVSGQVKRKTCGPECRRALKSKVVTEIRAQRKSDRCKRGHLLGGDNLKVVPHGNGVKRVCRECERKYRREYEARKAQREAL